MLLLISLNERGIRFIACGKRLHSFSIHLQSVFLPVTRKSVSVCFHFLGHIYSYRAHGRAALCQPNQL